MILLAHKGSHGNPLKDRPWEHMNPFRIEVHFIDHEGKMCKGTIGITDHNDKIRVTHATCMRTHSLASRSRCWNSPPR